MAVPGRLTKDHKAEAAFRPISDAEFARLSTKEKFRHIHLGMLELGQALVELAATTAATRVRQPHELPTTGPAHGDE